MHVVAGKAVAFKEALSRATSARTASRSSPMQRRFRDAPFKGHEFNIVSGGTDNHLFLLSLVGRDTTGKAAQIALDRAGITANKNMIPVRSARSRP